MDIRSVAARVPATLRRLLASGGVLLLAVAAARPGFIRMSESWAANSVQNYYYQYGYSLEGLVWLAFGLVAIFLALNGYTRANLRLTAAGAILALVVILLQPLAFHRDAPAQRGRAQMDTDLANLHSEVARLTTEYGHLPFFKNEIARLTIGGSPVPIIRSGELHQFRLIVAGQRDEVFQSPPVGATPGDIYYTISYDEKAYALSVVGLDSNVSDHLVIDQQLSRTIRLR